MREQIIIIGGGVIGLASAFELQRRGHKVTVLEKVRCGGQASGAAAGMLAPYSEIGEDVDDFFSLCLESLKLYPTWQKEIKEISKKEFEYTNSGSLHVVFHEADLLALESRQQWQTKFGAQANIVEGKALFTMEPRLTDKAIAAMHYPEESHIYAPDYVKALEAACRNIGVIIYDQLEEVKIVEWKDHIQLASKDGRTFTGERLVICSGAWAKELEESFHINIPVYPIRGQICAYEMKSEEVQHIIFTSQGYLVPKANGTLVSGASEDIAGFKTDITEKGISRLDKWSKKVFPFLNANEPFHKWAGLRPATQDGYPLLGKLAGAPHIIFATGHYRNGILLSPITAKAVADIIDGTQEHVPLSSFYPNRFN